MIIILCYNQPLNIEGLDLKLQTVFVSIVLLMAFIISGCSSRAVQVKNTGFFKDYDSINTKGSLDYSQDRGDISKYKNIIVAPVLVISKIKEEQQTPTQKKLYKDISEYLTSEYKKEIGMSGKYKLVEKSVPDTLKIETAISAVEVHLDDEKWNQFSPISLGLSVVSFNAYLDEDVRILGEKLLVDANSGDVLSRSMHIQKDEKIILNGENLEFKDVKPALDSWIEQVKKDLFISQ